MFKISKRKLIYCLLVFIVIIVFISVILVLKKFVIKKESFNSTTVFKNVRISSNDFNIEKITPIISKKLYKNYDWRIIISKINVDAPILEGVSKEVLRKGVGHFSNSGLLDGNICLAAHNRGYKYNYFQEIKKLEIGDDITYMFNNNIKHFEVISNNIIKETDMSAIENTNENKLTLITCEENKREYRRCIQAVEKL